MLQFVDTRSPQERALSDLEMHMSKEPNKQAQISTVHLVKSVTGLSGTTLAECADLAIVASSYDDFEQQMQAYAPEADGSALSEWERKAFFGFIPALWRDYRIASDVTGISPEWILWEEKRIKIAQACFSKTSEAVIIPENGWDD